MKIMVALVLAAALMACGGKAKNAAPAAGATTTPPADGTGGQTYGGQTTAPTPPSPDSAPATGGQ